MIFLKKINIHVIKKQRGNGGVSNKHQVKSWPRLVHAQGARSWKWNVNISPASPTHFFIIQFRNTCLKETNSHFIYTYPCVFSSWLQRNALFCPSVVSWQDFFWGLSLSHTHTQAIGQKEKRKRKVSHIEPLVSAGGSSLHTPGSLRACEASGAGRSQCAAPGHPVPLCPEVGVYPSPAPAPSIAKAFLTP